MRWFSPALWAPLLLACTTPEPPAPAPRSTPTLAAAHATYSPFGVHVAGPRLESISFKDVGLRLPAAQQAAVLEAVADAVAEHLGGAAEHHPEWATDAWHGQCRTQHVYVDLWQSIGPDRVGFSLWQGCSAEDRLMSMELPVPPGALESVAWVEQAARLGDAVAEAIGRCGGGSC